ncbi:unnamed protein product [Acanthosepion pharaonis]|uniref:Uncharacterized protein n=1 Tax=Acanthosepion pharaonis TaxID=158019 RepID=A0A812DR39_ACAPH|nr:unnamed protein product [Sepia pharaonis]
MRSSFAVIRFARVASPGRNGASNRSSITPPPLRRSAIRPTPQPWPRRSSISSRGPALSSSGRQDGPDQVGIAREHVMDLARDVAVHLSAAAQRSGRDSAGAPWPPLPRPRGGMSDRDRLATQRWIVALLHRRVEGVHVDVDDLAHRHAYPLLQEEQDVNTLRDSGGNPSFIRHFPIWAKCGTNSGGSSWATSATVIGTSAGCSPPREEIHVRVAPSFSAAMIGDRDRPRSDRLYSTRGGTGRRPRARSGRRSPIRGVDWSACVVSRHQPGGARITAFHLPSIRLTAASTAQHGYSRGGSDGLSPSG